ncbi:MAG: DNA-processing protein DprA [Thermoguttaceae bacterium]
MTLHDDILLSMVSGIGSLTYRRLIQQFGSSSAILDASRSDLSCFDFLKKDTCANILSARKTLDSQTVIDSCERENIAIVSMQDSNYPESLRTIFDPPPILYIRGTILPQDAFSIAVIGTRRLTMYGKRQTTRLSAALSKSGFTIISGLAHGIDTAAHRAALDAKGRTLAVLGSGLCDVYPSENRELSQQIVESGGAVLSEYPPHHPPATWTFPQRNRIVVGLSLGVLVIEAPIKSGAMISARMAGEQGRDLFAVPGPIESEQSRGTHQLIRDGAYLVESVDDILNVLGPMTKPVSHPRSKLPIRHPNETSLNDIEQAVLRQIDTSPTPTELIVTLTGLAEHQVFAALGALEKKRLIRSVSASVFVRM